VTSSLVAAGPAMSVWLGLPAVSGDGPPGRLGVVVAGSPPAGFALADLQALINQFTDAYNRHRPHRSLPHRATPATAYHALPKALPATSRDTRIRHDRIDESGGLTLRHAGRLHHIGIGRTHARTHIILLIDDLHVRVINAATGELLRELTIDPTRDYQPQSKNPPTP
jgi:hypothetical protein